MMTELEIRLDRARTRVKLQALGEWICEHTGHSPVRNIRDVAPEVNDLSLYEVGITPSHVWRVVTFSSIHAIQLAIAQFGNRNYEVERIPNMGVPYGS